MEHNRWNIVGRLRNIFVPRSHIQRTIKTRWAVRVCTVFSLNGIKMLLGSHSVGQICRCSNITIQYYVSVSFNRTKSFRSPLEREKLVPRDIPIRITSVVVASRNRIYLETRVQRVCNAFLNGTRERFGCGTDYDNVDKSR